jgi:hypothetical protein
MPARAERRGGLTLDSSWPVQWGLITITRHEASNFPIGHRAQGIYSIAIKAVRGASCHFNETNVTRGFPESPHRPPRILVNVGGRCKAESMITAQRRSKNAPLTTSIVLLTPSGAPLASATVKLYLRSWGDWPTMEPTTKFSDVCGVRPSSAEVGLVCEPLRWRCLSPRPNPRLSASARTRRMAAVTAVMTHSCRLCDGFKLGGIVMNQKKERAGCFAKKREDSGQS